MLICNGSNIAELYRDALSMLMINGTMTKPRGFNCKEISPCTLRLSNPCNNILNDNVRKINKAFAAAELKWMIEGRNDVEWIARFNSKISQFSDDGKIFFGAYGPKLVGQIEYVVKNLESDPWTRQAVMTFWRENPPKTKDVPCTIALHFIRRPVDTLNLIVYMRSNDIWLGLPYDIHNFTCIQMLVARELNLNVGTYTQVDGSLHAYEPDFDKISECIYYLQPSMFLKTRMETLMLDKDAIMDEYLRKKNENNNS